VKLLSRVLLSTKNIADDVTLEKCKEISCLWPGCLMSPPPISVCLICMQTLRSIFKFTLAPVFLSWSSAWILPYSPMQALTTLHFFIIYKFYYVLLNFSTVNGFSWSLGCWDSFGSPRWHKINQTGSCPNFFYYIQSKKINQFKFLITGSS
jgi:hypothetical protein